MNSRDEIIAFLLMTELFGELQKEDLENLVDQFEVVYLNSGDILINQGEVGDCLYIVASGRLRAFTKAENSEMETIIGEMGKGDLIGELALITKEKRSASVRAIRDSLLLKLSQADFDTFVQKNPLHVMPIMRTTILRIMNSKKTIHNTIATIAIAPAGNYVNFNSFAQILTEELATFDSTLHLTSKKMEEIFPQILLPLEEITKDQNAAIINWLSHKESQYRYVIYETDFEYTPWTRRCIRQADQVLLIACGEGDETLGKIEKEVFAKSAKIRKNVDLILLHNSSIKFPSDTSKWLVNRQVKQFHHLRQNTIKDLQRIARYLTGRAIGLVLGGGGARGFVHVGVYKALRELGINIDFVGGSSFGGLISCLIAMERTPEEITENFKKHMFAERGFFRLTMPIVSINTGRPLTESLKNGFKEPPYLEDLWKRFFCIICNLTTGKMEVRQTGETWKAMRATVSLPAIFPPITNQENDLLIDGGVLNNLPVDVMRGFINGGKIIASHVQTTSLIHADIPEGIVSGWKILLRRIFFPKSARFFPNIAEVVLRSIGLSSRSQENVMMSEADYHIDVDARKFRLLDFKSMDLLVDLGYRVTMEKMRDVKT